MQIVQVLLIALALVAMPLLGLPQANADDMGTPCAEHVDTQAPHHAHPTASQPDHHHGAGDQVPFDQCVEKCCSLQCLSGTAMPMTTAMAEVAQAFKAAFFRQPVQQSHPANPGELETPPPNA